MSAFEGTFSSESDRFDAFSLRLGPETSDGQLSGTFTNINSQSTYTVSGSILVPWSSWSNRYLFVLYGSLEISDPDVDPPIRYSSIAILGFAEADGQSRPINQMTLIQSWAGDNPSHLGHSVGSWPTPVGFFRQNS